jgi:hypothetical protein
VAAPGKRTLSLEIFRLLKVTAKDRSTMVTLGGLLDDANNEGSCPLSGGNTNNNRAKISSNTIKQRPSR